MSKLFTEGLAELRREGSNLVSAGELESAARRYLNQASRLLDLEESGVFRFWDADELSELIDQTGFEVLETHSSFGEPPQAIVITAVRR
jgi:hypothetical protein